MQRMKNLLLVLGGTLDALFLKECYEIQSYSPFHLKRMRQMQSLLCSLQ